MVSATASGVLLDAFRQRVDGIRAALDDELDETLIDRGDLLDRIGPDVGVEERAHAGLELLHVDVLASAGFDLVLHRDVVRDLGLDVPAASAAL